MPLASVLVLAKNRQRPGAVSCQMVTGRLASGGFCSNPLISAG